MTNDERFRHLLLSVSSSFVIRHSSFAMLPTSLVHEIDRLLQEGELSHRQIAKRLGVGRTVVGEIAIGRRGLHGMDPIDKRRARTPSSAPIRCSGRGYRVYLPCLICKARHQQPKKRLECRTGVNSNPEHVLPAPLIQQSCDQRKKCGT
jgi:hypothetical protein